MKLKERICEMEFTNFFLVLYWTVLIATVLLISTGGVYGVLKFTEYVGRLEPRVEVNSANQQPQIELKRSEPLLTTYEFQIEPQKIPHSGGCEYWVSRIQDLDATESEKKWMVDIMLCESQGHGCRADTVNASSGAYGIYQFMGVTWIDFGKGRDKTNPYHQIEVALEMYRLGLQSRWCCNKIMGYGNE